MSLWAEVAQWMSTPLIDAHEHDLLESYGYRAVESPVIYVVDNEQGDDYVIPYREISLVLPDAE